jgi:hypothetical protein
MNGKSLSLPKLRTLLLAALSCASLLATGCVNYRIHLQVTPDGKVEVTERAEAEPGIMDTLKVDPRLAWTAFEATVGSRGGKFTKDRPDSMKAAGGTYELDSWNELGQRGQAFKGIDEGERRVNPAQAASAVKDQYFYKDTTLNYKLTLKEPEGATVDSLAMPYAEKATGTLELEVPGTILKDNAPKKSGNLMTWPLAYGQTLDIHVEYREWQWVSIVSVVLVAIFLGYLAFSGIKALSKKGKAKPA